MVERFSQYTRVPCVVSEVRLHGTSPLLARARPSGGLFESQERDSRVWPNRSPKILEHRALCRRWDFVRQPPLVLALPLSRCLWCMRSSLACVRLAITHSRVGISFPAGFTYENGFSFVSGCLWCMRRSLASVRLATKLSTVGLEVQQTHTQE